MFTKYVSSITGPISEVALPKGGHTDWEVDLVVIAGAEAYRVSEADGWSHVAGLAVGHDISERIGEMEGPSPQFSLAKLYPGFSVIGPKIFANLGIRSRTQLHRVLAADTQRA